MARSERADFAPAPHSNTDVTDISGPEAVAAYLNHLASHLPWKEEGRIEHFLALMRPSIDRPLCKLAELEGSRLP